MNAKVRNIEVDSRTADLLEARARARGMTLAEFLADLATNGGMPAVEWTGMGDKGEGPWSPDGLAEDARRLAEFEQTRVGVPWDEIKGWMDTWGTASEFPPPTLRKL